MAPRRGEYWRCSFWTRTSYLLCKKRWTTINFVIQSIGLMRVNFRGLLHRMHPEATDGMAVAWTYFLSVPSAVNAAATPRFL